MRIGVDFDNTIVCYDALFHRVAREGGWIPETVPIHKTDVRDRLRSDGREEVWTRMQGEVYGARMSEAAPFPGVLEFFRACRDLGVPVCIISHKTRHPILGPAHDLHAAAIQWLEQQGFFDPDRIGLDRADVTFELTREAKLARIAHRGCTHFIDDLPEFLLEPGFPAGVERLLFDPGGAHAAETRLLRLTSWEALRAHLGLGAAPEPVPPEVRAFLRRHGLAPESHWRRLAGGANNQVHRIRAGSADLVVKSYFRHPADTRDRFRAERAFYEWTMHCGIDRTPEPVGWEDERRLGLFRHVAGRKLAATEVTADRVDEAAAFVRELNADREAARERGIPEASEACFSIREHLECIERRVRRLAGIPLHFAIDEEAVAFVANALTPAWRAVRRRIEKACAESMDRTLIATERCLSPSDFGFHNALCAADGRMRFLDFEYAGWDDPAKLVCDFFLQPRVPVGGGHWDRFVSGVSGAVGWGDRLRVRAEHLLPAYRIKWCCILLNEFLRGGSARRGFARGETGDSCATGGGHEWRRRAQLEKARQALGRLKR